MLYFIELWECCIPQTGQQTLKDPPRWRVQASAQLLPNAKKPTFISLLMKFEESNQMVQRSPDGQEATHKHWARKNMINYKENNLHKESGKALELGPRQTGALQSSETSRPGLAKSLNTLTWLWSWPCFEQGVSWALWPPEVLSDRDYSMILGSWIPAAEWSQTHHFVLGSLWIQQRPSGWDEINQTVLGPRGTAKYPLKAIVSVIPHWPPL